MAALERPRSPIWGERQLLLFAESKPVDLLGYSVLAFRPSL